MSDKDFDTSEDEQQQVPQQQQEEVQENQEEVQEQEQVQEIPEKLDPLFKYKKYLLKQVPVPEILEAIKDFESISPIDTTSSEFKEFIKEYCQTHFTIAKGDKDEKFIISEIGELDNGNYEDPQTQDEIVIDHYEQKIINKIESNVTEENNDFAKYRSHLCQHVKKYIDSYFDLKSSAFLVKVTGDNLDDMAINIIITSKQLRVTSSWSGDWISIWQISNNQLKGMIKINAHYFESGNVFVKQNKNHESALKISKSNPEEDSKLIVKEIENIEKQILTELMILYGEMGDNIFKQMRRTLPVTKQTLDWSQASLSMKANLAMPIKK